MRGCMIERQTFVQDLPHFVPDVRASEGRALIRQGIAGKPCRQRLHRSRQIEDMPLLAHENAILFVQHHAAACGNDGSLGVDGCDSPQRIAFAFAKAGPALCFHDLGHGAPRLFKKVVVGVDKGQREALRQQAADGRFAAGSWAHKEYERHGAS